MGSRLRTLLTGTPAVAIAIAVVVLLLPRMGLDVYWQSQVILIAVYTLICSGLNLGFGYAGELALGQVAIFAVGAYATAILCVRGHTDLLLALVVSAVLAGVVGFVVGLPGLRISGWPLALMSFFLVVLIPNVTQLLPNLTGGALGVPAVVGPTLFGQELSTGGLYIFAVILALAWLLVFRNLVVSPFGAALRTLSAGPTLVESLGLSAFNLRIRAYVIGALPAGMAGVLFAYVASYVSPGSFTLELMTAILAASVLGGSASVWGSAVGASLLILGPLQAVSFERYSVAIYGVFLVVVGVLFPGGLAALGRALRARVIARWDVHHVDEAADAVPEQLAIPGGRLVVSGVEKSFAGLRALNGVDMTVEPGTITAIIGANGAGKTTLLNVVSGILTPDAGDVQLEGEAIAGQRPSQVARLGVGRTFQTPIIPMEITAEEVVEAGRLGHGSRHLLPAIFRLPSFRRQRSADREAAQVALGFAGLVGSSARLAQDLPLGTRRLLEVVRSVAGQPRVLLLDEPAAGLDDDGLEDLRSLLVRIKDAGGTVVLVEHNVPFVMGVADRVFAMHLGTVIASGSPEEVRADPGVIDSYLGRRGHQDAAEEADADLSETVRSTGRHAQTHPSGSAGVDTVARFEGDSDAELVDGGSTSLPGLGGTR